MLKHFFILHIAIRNIAIKVYNALPCDGREASVSFTFRNSNKIDDTHVKYAVYILYVLFCVLCCVLSATIKKQSTKLFGCTLFNSCNHIISCKRQSGALRDKTIFHLHFHRLWCFYIHLTTHS